MISDKSYTSKQVAAQLQRYQREEKIRSEINALHSIKQKVREGLYKTAKMKTMGTKGIYIFEGWNDEVAVYKQDDNCPRRATRHIEAAKNYAWELPRFEADEFGAAFVAANKCQEGGGIRLIPPYKNRQELMEDMSFCDYCYVVGFADKLMVTVYIQASCAEFGSRWIEGETEALDDMLCKGGILGYMFSKEGK